MHLWEEIEEKDCFVWKSLNSSPFINFFPLWCWSWNPGLPIWVMHFAIEPHPSPVYKSLANILQTGSSHILANFFGVRRNFYLFTFSSFFLIIPPVLFTLQILVRHFFPPVTFSVHSFLQGIGYLNKIVTKYRTCVQRSKEKNREMLQNNLFKQIVLSTFLHGKRKK